MPLGTVATRNAKANARSFCCQNCTLSSLQIWTILYLNYIETGSKSVLSDQAFSVCEWRALVHIKRPQLDLNIILRFAMLCIFLLKFSCFILHITLKNIHRKLQRSGQLTWTNFCSTCKTRLVSGLLEVNRLIERLKTIHWVQVD